MNAQIFLYSSGNLLQALNKDRQDSICELPIGLRIGLFLKSELGIKDGEERPLSNEEVEKLLGHYEHFKPFFEAKGLLPVKKSEDVEKSGCEECYYCRVKSDWGFQKCTKNA